MTEKQRPHQRHHHHDQLSSGGSNSNPLLMMPMSAVASGASAGRLSHRRRKRLSDGQLATRWGVATAVLLSISGGIIFGIVRMHRSYINYIHTLDPNDPNSSDRVNARDNHNTAVGTLAIFTAILILFAIASGFVCWVHTKWEDVRGLFPRRPSASIRPNADV